VHESDRVLEVAVEFRRRSTTSLVGRYQLRVDGDDELLALGHRT
jgi:hypothetical protein